MLLDPARLLPIAVSANPWSCALVVKLAWSKLRKTLLVLNHARETYLEYSSGFTGTLRAAPLGLPEVALATAANVSCRRAIGEVVGSHNASSRLEYGRAN